MQKQFLKRVATLLSVLCLVTATVGAASFSDVLNHWSKPYAEDMAARGIILGYTDGTFQPDKSVTTAETLVMLSRMLNISQDIIDLVYADYQSYLTGLFGTEYSWAHKNFALCLASGVLTKTELEELYRSGSLGQSALKEDVSVYLVKAMGLTSETDALTTYTLNFQDTASITQTKRPYVYTLQLHNIVTGDTANNFAPKSSVSRGVISTMLSRAIEYMEETGIGPTLTGYTNYQSVSGTVQGVVVSGSSVTISLTSVFSGEKTVTASTSSKVYLDGVASAYNSITTGRYVLVRTVGNTVTAVNIYTSPKTITGPVVAVDHGKLTMTDSASNVSYKLMLTPDSEVQISSVSGNKSGNASIINPSFTYDQATCLFDSSYRVKALMLSGGSSYMDGTVAGVETLGSATYLLFSDYAGIVTRYEVPLSVAVTVNGAVGNLAASQKGCFVRLKIGNDDRLLKSVAVDTTTTVVQGSVKSVLLQATPQVLYIGDVNDTTSVSSAPIAEGAKVYYEGGAITAAQLQSGAFVSAKAQNGKITEIYSYSSTSQVKGTLSSVSFGSSIVLQIVDEEGKTVEFSLNPTVLPSIMRNSASATIDKLRGGDAVTVNIRYNKIASIEASAGKASTAGTVTKITMEATGNLLTVTNDNGVETTYFLASNLQVFQNDIVRTLYDVKIGNRVALVVSGSEVSTITIESTSAATSDLSGKVLFVNTTDSTFLLEVTDPNGTTRTVTINALNASRGSRIFSAEGAGLTLSDLTVNSQVTIVGVYSGASFEAKIIIRR